MDAQTEMRSTVEEYQNLVAENPYDAQNWENLLNEVKSGEDGDEKIAQLREIYGNLTAIFPTAVRLFLLCTAFFLPDEDMRY